MIDLHLHSIASDGEYSAPELFELAKKAGISAISIADHNSISSLKKAEEIAPEFGLKFLPCVEFDTLFKDRDLHLLAYGLEPSSKEWNQWMDEILKAKLEQTRKRVKLLNELGFKINYEKLIEVCKGKQPTGKDYIETMKLEPENLENPRFRTYIDGDRANSPYLNFYLDWLKAKRPAFVPFNEMEISGVLRKIKALGAVPVLAHPVELPEKEVMELIELGLEGVEAYTSYHSEKLSRHWVEFAKKAKIIFTAGSDYHGPSIKPEVKMGISCVEEKLILEMLEEKIKGTR